MNRIFYSLILISIFSSSILADEYSPWVKRIAELFDNMQYEECLKEIESRTYEELKHLSKKDIIEIYKYQAFIYTLMHKEGLSEKIINDIYEIDPSYEIPADVPPKLRRPFELVKKRFKPKEEEKGKDIQLEIKNPYVQEKPQRETPQQSFLEKNLTSISLGSMGIIATVIGAGIRLEAKNSGDDLRERLSLKDEEGKIIGISYKEAEDKKNEIDKNVMIGNILMGVGLAGVIGGMVIYYLGSSDKEENEDEFSVDIKIKEGSIFAGWGKNL